MAKNENLITGIYMRVSTEEQAKEGYSLDSQKRKLLAFCEVKGWTVGGIYCDEGISGSTIEKRPQATQMLEDAKSGKIQNILILKVDRLCRNTKNLLEIIELCKKHNIRLNAVEEQIDYTTPTGKMMLTMLGSFAELERSTITARMMAGKEQKVRNGYYIPTHRLPYGLMRDPKDKSMLVPNPEEKFVIDYIIEGLRKSVSMNKIAVNLKALGYKTRNGCFFTHKGIIYLLENPAIKGYTHIKISTPNGIEQIVTKASNITPVISEQEFDEVQILLKKRSQPTKQRRYADNSYWFTDVAYCPKCGGKYTPHSSTFHTKDGITHHLFYYKCMNSYYFKTKQCPQNKGIRQYILENSFIQFVDSILEYAKVDAKGINNNEESEKSQAQIKTCEEQIHKLLERKKRLLDLYLDEKLSHEDYNLKQTEIVSSINRLENLIDEEQSKQKKDGSMPNMDSILEFAKQFKTLWPIMDNGERRTFVNLHIKKMVVDKGGIQSIEFVPPTSAKPNHAN